MEFGIAIILIVISSLASALVSFHITHIKDRKHFDRIIDGNIQNIISEQHTIVRALANANGFGEKFMKAYDEEKQLEKSQIKLVK